MRWQKPQTKIGLETPLVGRIWGENKRLVFSPPNWYLGLVIACFGLGVWILFGRLVGVLRIPELQSMSWLGWALLFAGTWALLSMEYVAFDLRSRTYFRREGGGVFKKTKRGSVAEIDAVVVYCEHYLHGLAGQTVIYRIVFHWKNAMVPLLTAERTMTSLPTGAPLNHSAGPIVAKGQYYAQALGVRFFDNAHFHSAAPQSAI